MKKFLGPETIVICEVALFALLTFGFFQWFKHGRPSPVGDAAGKGLETAATFFTGFIALLLVAIVIAIFNLIVLRHGSTLVKYASFGPLLITIASFGSVIWGQEVAASRAQAERNRHVLVFEIRSRVALQQPRISTRNAGGSSHGPPRVYRVEDKYHHYDSRMSIHPRDTSRIKLRANGLESAWFEIEVPPELGPRGFSDWAPLHFAEQSKGEAPSAEIRHSIALRAELR